MSATKRLPAVQLTRCPQCGAAAEIERRAVLESTDGPIEHATVRCVARHWFMLPTAELEHRIRAASQSVAPTRHRT